MFDKKIQSYPGFTSDAKGMPFKSLKDDVKIFDTLVIDNTLQTYILYESHSILGYNGCTRSYKFLKRHYNWMDSRSKLLETLPSMSNSEPADPKLCTTAIRNSKIASDLYCHRIF